MLLFIILWQLEIPGKKLLVTGVGSTVTMLTRPPLLTNRSSPNFNKRSIVRSVAGSWYDSDLATGHRCTLGCLQLPARVRAAAALEAQAAEGEAVPEEGSEEEEEELTEALAEEQNEDAIEFFADPSSWGTGPKVMKFLHNK